MNEILPGGAVPSAGGTDPGTAPAQSASDSDAGGMQNFALLLSGMLQAKATALLFGGGDDGPPGLSGMDTDSSLLQMLFTAVSNGDEIDPDFAALLLGSLSGGTGGVALMSAKSGGAASAAAEAALLPLGNKSIASWAGSAADEAVPYNAWVPASPKITGNEGSRSAELLNRIIGQFDVESSGRYQPYKYGSDTYCNIFVWDVTSALGAEIPHFVDAQTGEPRVYPDVQGAVELDANETCDWLAARGREYGWREVSAAEAQEYANAGRPAVTALKNPGGSGHVQIVCPSKDGTYDSVRGVTVAQSGRNNCEYAYISSTMSSANIAKVRYFVHA